MKLKMTERNIRIKVSLHIDDSERSFSMPKCRYNRKRLLEKLSEYEEQLLNTN